MIQVAIKFTEAKDVYRLVEFLNNYPYHVDLVSGKRNVDAKSLLGAFALSEATGLKLSIYENLSNVDPSFLEGIRSFASGSLDDCLKEIA